MLKLEDIKKDAHVCGIQSGEIVRIVQVESIGDAAMQAEFAFGHKGTDVIAEKCAWDVILRSPANADGCIKPTNLFSSL